MKRLTPFTSVRMICLLMNPVLNGFVLLCTVTQMGTRVNAFTVNCNNQSLLAPL